MSTRRIAALLKLSPAAVSMALNNHPKIPQETRRRVRAAARRLGYKPNAKIAELMGQIRSSRHPKVAACFGVISFYDTEYPWEKSLHLARMYEGMERRATALGYRIEPFRLRAAGVTPRRLRNILDARGIEGLLCFGSERMDEEFPAEFDHYAIVTQGWSIKAPLHRIVNHGHNTTWRALEELHALNYRRPGMIIGQNLDVRSARANVSAYLGWCEHFLGDPASIPVLRVSRADEQPILQWLKRHCPDAILFLHEYGVLPEFADMLRRSRIRVPQDVGVAAISHLLDGTSFSGLQENQPLMGECAIELLISRIMNRDFGIPKHPRVEMVESVWVDGKSLRPQPA